MPEQSLEKLREYIDKRLAEGSVDRGFYKEYGRYMSEGQIDKALDIGEDLWALYQYAGHKFTPEQIDRALDIGEDLWALYQYAGHKFTPEQIEKAMEISDKDELNILFNTLQGERPDLLEAIKQYKTKQVIEQYPQARYFDPKTYKVDRFIDALKIIR
jgi:hypothetical protein